MEAKRAPALDSWGGVLIVISGGKKEECVQFGRISVCPVVRSTTLGAVCRGSGNLPSSGLDLRYVWDTGERLLYSIQQRIEGLR